MQFIAVGGEAVGFIAIGQEAKGVFALGQKAIGVVAVGQMAMGCFTVGQLAFGLTGWGQLGFGVWHAVGMLGAGGRGFGIVLPLTPSVGRRRIPPETIALESVFTGAAGWVEVDLFVDEHGLGLGRDGRRLPVKLDRRLQTDARALTVHGPRSVWAFVEPMGSALVCTRIQHAPPRPFETPGWYTWGAIQFVGLTLLATVWWVAVGDQIVDLVSQLLG